MTTEDLLNYEIVHAKAGNAYAVVELIDDKWCRITSKYCDEANRNRAWLAAVSQLSVFEISPGTDPDGKPYPKEKKKLTDDELFPHSTDPRQFNHRQNQSSWDAHRPCKATNRRSVSIRTHHI